MLPARHAGAFESTSNASSYTDTAGAYMDLDAGGTFAQFGAKGPGSIGLKLRTILAGVALTVLTFAAAGAATFVGAATFGGAVTSQGATAGYSVNRRDTNAAVMFMYATGDTTMRWSNFTSDVMTLSNAGALTLSGGLAVNSGTAALQTITGTSLVLSAGAQITGVSAGALVATLTSFDTGTTTDLLRYERSGGLVRGVLRFHNTNKFQFGPTTAHVLDLIANNTVVATVNAGVGFDMGVGFQLRTSGSTAGQAGFRLQAGVAPTAPVDGEMWNDGTNLKARIGGATVTIV